MHALLRGCKSISYPRVHIRSPSHAWPYDTDRKVPESHPCAISDNKGLREDCVMKTPTRPWMLLYYSLQIQSRSTWPPMITGHYDVCTGYWSYGYVWLLSSQGLANRDPAPAGAEPLIYVIDENLLRNTKSRSQSTVARLGDQVYFAPINRS